MGATPAPGVRWAAEVTIYHLGRNNIAERTAKRLAAGTHSRVAPVDSLAALPERAVVVARGGDGADGSAFCRMISTVAVGSCAVMAIVPDHAAGYAAVQTGAAAYVLTEDVDGPAAAAALDVARRRATGGPADDGETGQGDLLFAAGTDGTCLSAAAMEWLLRQTMNVMSRRGEIGYLLLAQIVPTDERTLSTDARSRLAARIAARLVGTIRAADIAARMEDLLFAVLVEVGHTLDGANVVADRLSRELSRPYTLGSRVITVRVDVGTTTFGSRIVDPRDVMQRARNALAMSLSRDRLYG